MQGNNLFSILLMYGAIGAIFYFILLRPQQKQRKKHQEMLTNLKKGDEIVTAGGLIGSVVHIATQGGADNAQRNVQEDRVTIQSGETRVVIERGRIARVISPTAGA